MLKSKLISLIFVLALTLSACETFKTTSPAENTVAPTTDPPTTEQKADECLSCHADKQRLIETAKPEEKKESESKGVG